MATSTGQSWMWNNWIPIILKGEALGVSFDTVLKDFGYALSIAAETNVEPKITEEASSALSRWRKAKGGSKDLSSAFGFLASDTNGGND